MRLSTFLVLAFALPLLLSAKPARAAARTAQVVVLPTRASAGITQPDLTRLGDAVWAALSRLSVHRVADTDREAVLAGEAELRGCLDRAECMERLGRLLEASHVLQVAVSGTAAQHSIEVRLFDVDVGETSVTESFRCGPCQVEEVARGLDAAVEKAIKADRLRPRATLTLRSTPQNADVQIDGRRVGFTDLERRVFAGPHDLVVSLSRLGLQPEHMHVEISADQRLVLQFAPGERVAPPAPAVKPAALGAGTSPESQRRSRWRVGLGVPLLVLGLGGVGLGATSLALDGRCIGDGPPCAQVFDTRLPGIIEIAAGGALLVAGVALLASDAVAGRRARTVALVPGPGQAGLALSLTY